MAGLSLGGLASGMDTEALITQLMTIERQPKIRLQQRELVEDARKGALTDIRTRLQNLATAYATLSDAATWSDVQTVESSDPAKIAVTRVGGAAAGATSVTVSRLASADQISHQNAGFTTATSADKLTIAVGAKTITVNVAAGDNLDAIASNINGSSNAPVYATVLAGKLVLSGKTTGASETIAVSDGDTTNGYDLATDLFGVAPLTHSNADARLSLDGGATWVTRASNTITDLVAGVSLTLKGTTTTAVSVTVGEAKPDSAAIQTKIQAFVDQYNSTVDFIQGKIEEKKVAKPTTTAERSKGVLSGDGALTGLLAKLRQAVSDKFTGNASFANLSEVGLSTGKTTGAGTLDQSAIKGRLSLDTATLTSKLSSKFSDVKQLFTNPTSVYDTQGLQQRFAAAADPWIRGDGTNGAILDAQISSSDAITKALRDREAELDLRLTAKEKTLRAQFSRLETTLSQSQSKGAWLTGQIASLPRR
jgi:flagellar hook-associated protein 2